MQRKSNFVDTKGVCCRKHKVHVTGTERRDEIRSAQQQLQLKPGDWNSRRGTSAARAKQECCVLLCCAVQYCAVL